MIFDLVCKPRIFDGCNTLIINQLRVIQNRPECVVNGIFTRFWLDLPAKTYKSIWLYDFKTNWL